MFPNSSPKKSSLSALVLLTMASFSIAASPAHAAQVGSACPKAGATEGAGASRIECANVAKAGQRARLRWKAAPANVATTTLAQDTATLTVYSGRTYGVEGVYEEFTKETGIRIKVVTGNDTANRARLRSEASRTAADIYMTVDIASLAIAANEGLLKPLTSTTLMKAIPAKLRDGKGRWFGLSRRARVLYINTKNVKPTDYPKRYEDLGTPAWKGRLCLRPSSHVYTQSLAANFIAADPKSARTVLQNLARNAKQENFIDSDPKIIETVNAGGCDAGIANSYYFFRPGLKRGNVKQIFPNQAVGDRGTHVNVSGAGVVAASRHPVQAQRFLEWLATTGNAAFVNGNNEFPANPATKLTGEVASVANFKADEELINDYPAIEKQAAVMLAEVGWR
jgi:iron(III) transport system substrate-binding protein